MRILKIIGRNRRDFSAIFKCEHCGDEITCTGYDDSHFHNNIVPDMDCSECGKKSPDSYQPLTPKYPDHAQV